MRALYATDASVYREWPLAVALPRHAEDIRALILFARTHGVSLIPRAAGTSLAGQCVGNGIVVDVSKYLNRILAFNAEEGWVRVEPGVVRDELNAFLEPHGFFFGPNTSTANRCMIGGMVGNNSCGTTSIVYGSTRDHVLEMDVLLSDGSTAVFGSLTPDEFAAKTKGNTFEHRLYQHIATTLSPAEVQAAIREAYPRADIHRRNTGYALDELLDLQPFHPQGEAFNFCKLLCGSEGTLAFTTAVKLHVDPLPLPEDVVLCAHFSSVPESMQAVLLAMEARPTACELMDKIILDCTRENLTQQRNRFFVEGDPGAILMIEFRGETPEAAAFQAEQLAQRLRANGLGYAYPVVRKPDTKKVWALRNAGLGVLANIPGDAKAVACIEDTAVAIADLPQYVDDFAAMMEGFGQQTVYYAHAGAGELHLRPILNLKRSDDRQKFYELTRATAELVKRYRGSLSGEHGDGRVRAPFIPLMIGEENYERLRNLKHTWDPQGIFNPGKIVDAPPMNEQLRYEADRAEPEINTLMDWTATRGILRAAEQCNGSGDCRKLALSGGTMCPSYRATRNEKDTTRARANALREFLTMNVKENPFNHPEIYEAMDLCLSCKACKSECPSNVDMASLKAEFLHQYYQSNGVPLRAQAIANIGRLNQLGMIAPGISNLFLNGLPAAALKKFLGVAPQRSLPQLAPVSLRTWFGKTGSQKQPAHPKGTVYFFCDEFTNYNDAETGKKAILLLQTLGYRVEMPPHADSGRAHISKGLLEPAQHMARQNIAAFAPLVGPETPLVGIEPSAILSFRDEYLKLAGDQWREQAERLAPHCLQLESFLAREFQAGRITPDDFTDEKKEIVLHGHCHQKALTGPEDSAFALGMPRNYSVQLIPSGCCGMAGSFGYEKEHYAVSMQVAEDVLFPFLRKQAASTLIAAPGTSCRHQIADGLARQARHPAEILYDALR